MQQDHKPNEANDTSSGYIPSRVIDIQNVTGNLTVIDSIPLNDNKLKIFTILGHVLHNAYWPIFGELRVYDEFKCTKEACPQPYTWWHVFVFFLLMLYSLAILVLVNLLIAMFK